MACAYISISTVVYALEDTDALKFCEDRKFNNSYFLFDNNHIAEVANYFNKIPLLDANDGNWLVSLSGKRDRIFTYYDFDNLELYHSNKELLYILDNNLPDYRIEKEQISYIDINGLSYNTNFEIKKYNKKVTSLDKHPLFSRIKRKQRQMLINMLSEITHVRPESVSESLVVHLKENVNLISQFGVPYGEVSLVNFTISNFGIWDSYYLLKFEIYHTVKDSLTSQEKKYLDIFFCNTKKAFQEHFPMHRSLPWFGYVEYHKLANADFPSRMLFRKYPELFSLGQIFTLVFIGFLFLAFIFGRYSRKTKYRKISKTINKS